MQITHKQKVILTVAAALGIIILLPIGIAYMFIEMIVKAIVNVIKAAYATSVFNEFGRSIIYMKENSTMMLSSIAALPSDTFGKLYKIFKAIKNDDMSNENLDVISDLQNTQTLMSFLLPTLPYIQNKEELYAHLRLFAKVGVFEYKNGHAKLRIIKHNSRRIENTVSLFEINESFFQWRKKTNLQGSNVTQHTREWLLLVDKNPPDHTDFSTIGVLTGSKFMSLKHTDEEAQKLFEAYGMKENKSQWGTKTDGPRMYKVKRVLSRIKRGFQANILRQKVNLSRTRTRTRERRAPEATDYSKHVNGHQ